MQLIFSLNNSFVVVAVAKSYFKHKVRESYMVASILGNTDY